MSFPRYPAYKDSVFEPPRALEAIDADLARVTDRIKAMIEGLSA